AEIAAAKADMDTKLAALDQAKSSISGLEAKIVEINNELAAAKSSSLESAYQDAKTAYEQLLKQKENAASATPTDAPVIPTVTPATPTVTAPTDAEIAAAKQNMLDKEKILNDLSSEISRLAKLVEGEIKYIAVAETLKVMPEILKALPELLKANPETLKVMPEILKALPELLKANPELLKVMPEILKALPEILRANPETLKVMPEILKALPEILRANPETLKVMPEILKALPEILRANPETLKVMPEILKALPEILRANPETLKVMPEILKALPEILRANPEILKALPEILKALPEILRANPETLKALPEILKALPEILKALPEILRANPEILKALPEILKALPEILKALPETINQEWWAIRITWASGKVEEFRYSEHPDKDGFVEDYGTYEKITYNGEGEAEIAISETETDIYSYTVVNSKYVLSSEPIAHVKVIGTIELPDGSISTILQRTGKDAHIFAVNPTTGALTVQYFAKPQVLNGVKIDGEVVVDLGELKDGLSMKRKYYYSGDQLYDNNASLVNNMNNPVAGWVIDTAENISGLPAADTSGWKIVKEFDAAGNLSIMRVFDKTGVERGTITTYNNEYLFMSNEDSTVGANSPNRIIYRATFESGTYKINSNEVYLRSYDRTSIDMQIDDAGNAQIPQELLNELPTGQQIMDPAQLLQEGLNNIIKDLGLTGTTVHIVKEEVRITDDGVKFNYRILEDPWARVIMYKTSDTSADTIINTTFDKGNSTAGYRFSHMGYIFRLAPTMEGLGDTMQPSQVLSSYNLSPELIKELSDKGVNVNGNLSLVKVTEFLITQDEDGKIIETPQLVRYIAVGDPLRRDYARYDRGALRFMKLASQTSNAPFGISVGEVVVSPEINKVIRETEYTEKDGDVYIYRVIYELREGVEYKNKPIYIGYNFKTDEVWEHYINDGMKIYTKDGIPFYISRFTGVQDKFNVDSSTLYTDLVKGAQEFSYSSFVNKVYHQMGADGQMHTYIMSSENINSTTPLADRNVSIIRDGKLWIMIKGDFIKRDVYGAGFLSVMSDKIHNAPAGRFLSFTKDGEDIRLVIENIEKYGTEIKASITNEVASKDKFVDSERSVLSNKWTYIFIGILPFLMTLLTSIFGRLRFKKNRSKEFTSNDTDLTDELFVKHNISVELLGPALPSTEYITKLSSDARKDYVKYYLSGQGYTNDEIDALIKYYESRDYKVMEEEVNPKARPRAPPLTTEKFNDDLSNAVAKGYSKALVIQSLIDKKLIDQSDMDWALEVTKAKVRRAMRWDALKIALIQRVQNRVFEQIKKGDLSRVNDLLPTAEARELQITITNNLITSDELSHFANNSTDFISFVREIRVEHFITPAFNSVFNATLGTLISQKDKDLLLGSVCGALDRAISLNPKLLIDLFKNGDVVYNPYPMNKATEPTTLRDLVLLKMLMVNPSQTKGHSFGNGSLILPAVVYAARQINKAVSEGKSVQEIQAIAEAYVKVFTKIIVVERARHAAISTRDPWVKSVSEMNTKEIKEAEAKGKKIVEKRLLDIFFDEDMYDFFESLSNNNETLLGVFNSHSEAINDKVKDIFEVLQGQNKLENDNDLIRFLAEQKYIFDANDKENSKTPEGKKVIESNSKDLASLCSVLKAITLELRDKVSPEAVAADKATGKKYGIFSLYGRMAKMFLSLKNFWGIDSSVARKALVVADILAVAGAVVLTILNPGFPLGVLLFAVGFVVMVLPIMFGKATRPSEKLFWGGIFTVASGYTLGLMAHHLFWKASVLVLSPGLFVTIGIMALCFIPTIISVYHLFVTGRSYLELQNELWSKTARSLTGVQSFLPFRFNFWEKKFGAWTEEIKTTEEEYGSIIGTGETFAQYLERNLSYMHSTGLLDDNEFNSWIKALNGQQGGRFVDPKSGKGHEMLYNIFFAASQKKASVDSLMLLAPTNTHVQAAGELFTHTIANSMLSGTFNYNPKDGRATSLLGHMAVYNKVEWNNILDLIAATLNSKGDNEAIKNVIEGLRQANHYTDFIGLIYGSGLENDQSNAIINMILDWLNEMRPSNRAVVKSMGKDFVEYHLYTSSQLGDFVYNAAIKEIALANNFISLKDAFEKISKKLGENLTESEKIFYANYKRYQSLVDSKLREIFNDGFLWSKNKIDPATRKIAEINSLKNFVAGLNILKKDENLPEDIKRDIDKILNTAAVSSPSGMVLDDWAEEFTSKVDAAAVARVLNYYAAAREKKIVSMLEAIISDPTFPEETKILLQKALRGYKEADQASKDKDASRLNNIFDQYSSKETPLGEGKSTSIFSAAEFIDKCFDVLAPEKLVKDVFNDLNLFRGIAKNWEETTQYASIVSTANENNVMFGLYDPKTDDIVNRNKNGGIGTNLWLMYPHSSNFDAHVRAYPGQNVWRLNWATLQGRNSDIAIINPMMKIWASSNFAFPGTRLYAI
ncbi:MAG: hypothetical protein WCY09_08700, partial [Candidatus Omnitrophota bacterium]